MKKTRMVRTVVLTGFLWLFFGATYAQKAQEIQVTHVQHQQGWFDVGFPDLQSAYSLKALLPEKAGNAALIQRLYIDERQKVARVEAVNKEILSQDLKAAIEKSLGLHPSGAH